MIIDTHAHLNFNAFKNDAEKIIEHSLAENCWLINVGSQFANSKKAVEMAEKHKEGVYAAIGMHPIHAETEVFKPKMDPEELEADASKEKDFEIEKYRELARSPKVVAIGEIGLDYYYRPKTKTRQEIFKQKQREVFFENLKLAKELSLPVIFHCRMAHDDLIAILANNPGLRGVIHCFTGTLKEAEQYIKMGFYIGLNGIIFKLNLDEAIKIIPLDKILTETDCPYLTPPAAGQERNEPLFIKYVIQKIAELKSLSFEEVAAITSDNAKKLFGI